MQTFKQKKLALAVGSALLVMAGAAQSAPNAPTVRTLKPALITAVTSPVDARGFYDGTGYTGAVTITLNFTAPNSALTNTNGPDIEQISAGSDGFMVNGATLFSGTSLGGLPPATTTDDVSVYVNGATNTTLPTTNLGFTANIGGATAGGATTGATALFSITPGASVLGSIPAFRLTAAGILEWTADIAKAVTAWLPVKISVNAPTAVASKNVGIVAYDRTSPAPAPFTGMESTVLATASTLATPATTDIYTTIVPAPIVSTKATNGLVSGANIDTLTPLVGFAAANVAVSTASGFPICADVLADNTAIPFTLGAATSSRNPNAVNDPLAATGIAKYGVDITNPGSVTWSATPALSAAAYNSTCFNTGINDGTVPFDVTLTGMNKLTYSAVFDAAGAPVSAAAGATPILLSLEDGAPPVITAVEYTVPTAGEFPTSKLVLTFSEPMQNISTGATGLGSAADLREVTQNVQLGGNSIAALNLNSGMKTTELRVVNTADNKGVVTVGPILAADLVGKQVIVNNGVTFKEPNDNGYSAVENTLDNIFGIGTYTEIDDVTTYNVQLSGGIDSASGAVEAASGNATTALGNATVAPGTTAVPAVVSGIVFAKPDAKAVAITGSDPTKIHTIRVTFVAGKDIKLNSANTLAEMQNDLVVTINGVSGTTPVTYQFKPTSVTIVGQDLIIILPTDLIYSKMDSVKTASVAYLPAGETGHVLMGNTATTIAVAAGDVNVKLPLPALTGALTNSTLYTQSISGYFDAATAPSNGSSVAAYLAKWVDTPVMWPTVVDSIRSGKISNPGDNVAKDLAIEFVDGGEGGGGGYGWSVVSAVNDELYKAVSLKDMQALAKKANALAARLGSVVSKLAAAQINQAIKDAAAAAKTDTAMVMQKQIPVYVKMVRSSDKQASAKLGQNYLEARAIMATAQEFKDGRLHGNVSADTAATNGAGAGNGDDPVYQVMLDVTTGKITGRLTGQLVFDKSTGVATERGLYFVDSSGDLHSNASDAGPVADGVVTTSVDSAGGVPTGTLNSFNLLLGVDPKWADTILNLADTFVLAVLTDPGAPGATAYQYTLLTSANPAAANYVPFDANLLTLKGTRTKLSNTAAGSFDLAKLKVLPLAPSTNWALYGTGVPDVKAGADIMKAFDRNFVGLNMNYDPESDTNGYPKSFWTSDGACCDMAITLLGNKAAVAVESWSNGATASTITGASVLKGANALAWANDIAGGSVYGGPDDPVYPTIYPAGILTDALFVQQAAFTGVVKLPAGWSLVNIPGVVGTPVTSLGDKVDAVIKVGSQADVVVVNRDNPPLDPPVLQTTQNQFTWIKATDGAMPALTAGEAVFVYSKTGGSLLQ